MSGAGEPVCLPGGEALHHDPLIPSPPSPPHSEGTVDKRRSAPPSPLPRPEPHSKEEGQLEAKTDNKEEEEEEEGAPLELMAEFLSSVMRRDLGLASRLCHMILVHEPENPEAVQFLPLIQQKLLEDQEKELGTDDEEDDDEEEGDDSDEDTDDSESCDEDDHSGGSEGSTHD
ncbi:glutamate-rich protein 2-like isoform X1 [Gadus macrocephalus]|uniref:glutamate-rich protein 2-like isoform X1 n=2 Tax=Gadus macrocephalus TaxID=80720 RepID=UPI0028CB4800|nr:glutamate-rich protein 2-like isoform X1 [Gadus macrocephalus]